jgi:uncharacterized protein YjbI with pentapeptide repeats
VTDSLPSITPGATTEATPGSQDIPVTPPPGDQLEALSNNPGAQSQYIQTTSLAAGTYIVQVSGYNGAFSPQPYLLQANILGGETAPSCPGAISYLGSLGSPATGPVAIPNGVNTLFLVDTQRLSAAFGSKAEGKIMTQLQAVSSDSSAGVTGAVIPVDAYAAVQAAYATWNSNPCSVAAANAVTAAISSVVDQIRADNPTVQNLVIVGADDQIPFARIADGATESNERDYGATTFAGENNVEADALSLGYYFSDDPYSASTPLGVGSATLYLPQLAEGRLVESAAEIEGALSRFVSSNGDLDATASLTTGYSFLTSGAQAVSANLAADGLNSTSLINGNWQESTLDAALAASTTPGVDSLNAHFDYSRALPAYDDTNQVDTNLFNTTDVRNPPDPTSYAGRLLFSMGCHAGLDIDDAEVATSGLSTPVDDWAKTFADAGALWVANTGYGYADTDTIAYSAKLMSGFAGNLNGSLTVGEALSQAKQQYAAGDAVLSPYDLKALMESTLYGLPMYHLNTAGTPVPPPNGPPTETDPTTGLTVAPVSLSLGQGNSTSAGQLGLVSTSSGDYYQVNGSNAYNPGTQVTEYRPIEPLVAVPATETNLVPHGALVTALDSIDTPNFTPVYSMPAVGSADAAPPAIGDAAFPGTLQRVATYGAFTSTGTTDGAQLDLVAGQFFPNPSTPGIGTQRIFKSMSAHVFYMPPGSPLADDYTPATIGSSDAATSPSGVNFAVQVAPSSSSDPVTEVLVLYTDATNPGAWTPVTLTSASGSSTWTGSGSSTPSGNVQYIVEAVDAAGNVAVSNNEGADFNGAAQPAISISLSGRSLSNGYYTGAVTVDITAPSGSTYVLDGSSPLPVPSSSVVVTGDGEHTITVTDPQGGVATQAFAISTSQTSIVVSSDADPSVVGQVVTLTATVGAATAGAGSPTGYVEFEDGGTAMAGCGDTTGEPLSRADTATCHTTYTSPGTHQITATYLGDGNFSGSAATLPQAQIVDQAAVTTAVSSSVNPSVVGQPVIYTATVAASSPGAGTPSGYVEFLDDGAAIAACGGSSGVLLYGARAGCTVTYTSPGSQSITASYLGDANFNGPSNSAALSEGVQLAATTTTLSSSVNPSLSGRAVTYSAEVVVTGPGAGTPSGYVEFLASGTPISACGGATGKALLSGAATCKQSYSTTGAHNIVATFLGAIDYLPSTSPTFSQIVTPSACPTLAGCNLSDLDLTNANFRGANLSGADLQGADLSGANLRGTNLSRANLIGANLTGANATGAVMSGAKLSGATLTDAILSGAAVSGATLKGANMTGAIAIGGNFSGDNMSGANLTNADFSDADLSYANLTGANTTGTNFTGANLTGTIF